jgi:hypothetical protein
MTAVPRMGPYPGSPTLEHDTSLVYNFEYFDSKMLLWTQSDAFATADTIHRWHGLALRATECAVPSARLDPAGIFLDGPPPPAPLADQLIDCVI